MATLLGLVYAETDHIFMTGNLLKELKNITCFFIYYSSQSF